jgi:hypothetical protein
MSKMYNETGLKGIDEIWEARLLFYNIFIVLLTYSKNDCDVIFMMCQTIKLTHLRIPDFKYKGTTCLIFNQ